MPLVPPKRRKRPLAPSAKPGSLTLLAEPRKVIWLPFQKRFTVKLALYLSSVPYPASALPNQPLCMPFFTVRFITVSSSPSSTPVIRARSLFRFTTCSFSTMFTGRFREATVGSSLKNSLPSTSILLISCPLAVILPSLLTSTPGRRFSRSSTTALGCVLYDSAANSTVSSITFIGVRMPVTVASFKAMALSASAKGLMVRAASPILNWRVWVAYPTYDASIIYLPGLTSMLKRPWALVTAAFTTAESLAASTRREACISPSPVAASTMLPRNTAAGAVSVPISAMAASKKKYLNPIGFMLQN